MDEGKTLIFVSHSPAAIRSICRRVCVLDGGELEFDGEVEGGLAFYERALERRTEPVRGSGSGATGGGTPEAEAMDSDRVGHRVVAGSHWTEAGRWQFEFLRQQGLEPGHYVLDVGCGSLGAAIHLMPFLDEHHYWGIDSNRAQVVAGLQVELPQAGVIPERGFFLVNDAFELNEIPYAIDIAVANSLFSSVPFNSVAKCIASVVRKLKPSGRFYATWFENPDPSSFEPILHPNGVTTYPDREPFHYPFELIASVCQAVGATVDRVAASEHPRGEGVLVICAPS
jgi:SAM-dependent methyltransferase